MISKVFFVGTPSDHLRQELGLLYPMEQARSMAEATEAAEDSLIIVDCPSTAELSHASSEAARFPSLTFLFLVGPACEAALNHDSLSNVHFVPASASPMFVSSQVRQLSAQLVRQSEQTQLLENSVNGSVAALFEVLSINDPYSASLGQRLRYAVETFAKSAGLDLSWDLETAALLANIGVLTIPTRVIQKNQSGQELSGYEKELIAKIPERGADLLQHIPCLQGAARIVRYQSKNFDGSGLPNDSASGDRIPAGARILKVVSDLFNLGENGMTQSEAIAELGSREGRYDPRLLALAAQCFKVNLPETVSGNTQPLQLKELKPGQLLVSNILTSDGVLLIRDGQVISPKLLHKLRNFAFTSGVKEPIHVIDLLESRKMSTTFGQLAHSETSFFVKR